MQFQKSQKQVKALLNSGSKVNVINPAFTQKLGLYIWKTNVEAQKIYDSTLETFKIKIADLEVEDKAGRFKFFQETFLVADTKFETVLKMLFLKISIADVLFNEKRSRRNLTLPTTLYLPPNMSKLSIQKNLL